MSITFTNLTDMERELDRLASCASFTPQSREATRCAAELLRAFIATFGIERREDAAALYRLASAPTVYVLQVSNADGDTCEVYRIRSSAIDAGVKVIEEYRNNSRFDDDEINALVASFCADGYVAIGDNDYVRVGDQQVN